MSLVLLARHKTRLRKQRLASQRSSVPAVGSSTPLVEPVERVESDIENEKTKGLVRVGYTVFPIHAKMLNELLIDLRQMTGSRCTSSDIIRIAIDELVQRPLPEVANLLKEADPLKPRRRPQQK